MSDLEVDDASNVEDGMTESVQAGAALKHLPEYVRNQIKRRAPQSKAKKVDNNAMLFLQQIERINSDRLLQQTKDAVRAEEREGRVDRYGNALTAVTLLGLARELHEHQHGIETQEFGPGYHADPRNEAA